MKQKEEVSCVLLVVDIVVVKDLGIPANQPGSDKEFIHSGSKYIIIFHVSTGRSASLNDQSNFSSAAGSSVGS